MSDLDDLDAPILPEEDSTALNEGGVDTATTGAPTDGKQTAEDSKVTGSEGKPSDGEATPEGDPKPGDDDSKGRPEKKSRVQERIGELTGRLHEKDETIAQLEAELATATRQAPELKRDENGETTVDDIVEHNKLTAEQIADQKVKALEVKLEAGQVATRYDSEVADSLKRHSMLDPDSDKFNPKVAAAVEKAVRDKINPHLLAKNVKMLQKISPAQVINEIMEGVYAAQEAARGEATKSLTQARSEASDMFGGNAPATQGDEDEFTKAFNADIS